MPSIEDTTRAIWRDRRRLEGRTAVLRIVYPLPGSPSGNLFVEPSDSGGEVAVEFTAILAGWGLDAFSSDGYRIRDDRKGRAILFRDEHVVPDRDGVDQPLAFEHLRALCDRPGVRFIFNGEAVTFDGLEDDPRANAVVVRFKKVK